MSLSERTDTCEEEKLVKENTDKLWKIVLAGLIQLTACFVVYMFHISNPNIVLFVILSAVLVQLGYAAGMVCGGITFLYSAFFFSTEHSWIYYTPLNRDKLIVITLGIIANILLIGHL